MERWTVISTGAGKMIRKWLEGPESLTEEAGLCGHHFTLAQDAPLPQYASLKNSRRGFF